MHCLAQRTLYRHLRLCFIQSAFQLGQDRRAFLLSTGKPLFIAEVLELALDAVQLVDHHQRDIGPSGFTLGLHFLRVYELASCMGHARQTFHTWLRRQRVIADVVVYHAGGRWLASTSKIDWLGLDPVLSTLGHAFHSSR